MYFYQTYHKFSLIIKMNAQTERILSRQRIFDITKSCKKEFGIYYKKLNKYSTL